MARTPKRKPDLEAFFSQALPVRVGVGGYTSMDRYRDFRKVFTGSVEGRRVLSQIIALCDGKPVLEDEASNLGIMAYRAGMRRVGLEIVRFCNQEPSIQSDKTDSRG